jgi:prepilin-type processing-associated H-X9-DG protein
MNGYVTRNFNRKNMLYIDGHTQTRGDIARFINSSISSLFSANCCFEEHSNDKEFFMKKKEYRFVVVHVVHSLSPGDELLINYNFCRPPIARQKCLALGLPLAAPLGHKKKNIE